MPDIPLECVTRMFGELVCLTFGVKSSDEDEIGSAFLMIRIFFSNLALSSYNHLRGVYSVERFIYALNPIIQIKKIGEIFPLSKSLLLFREFFLH